MDKWWVVVWLVIIFKITIILLMSRVLSIVSGYGLDDRAIAVRSPAEVKGFFLQPLCPDRLWDQPSLLYNGYRGSFPRELKRGRGVKLTTHPHLVPRSRMSRSYTSSPPPSVPVACCATGLLYCRLYTNLSLSLFGIKFTYWLLPPY
jgi:hypothetical protein